MFVKFLWFLLVVFLLLLPPFLYYFRKFSNPYKLTMIFGKKGSGKTTLLAKICYKGLKKGKKVFSTEQVPGVIRFPVDVVGLQTFPEDSILTIDEAGMKYDSREFKTFPKHVRNYFKYQRHEKHTVYLFSQSFDLDKKIRDLTDAMYLCTCHFNFISVARKIKKNFKIVEASAQGESRIADNLEFEPLWLALFGVPVCIITLIPRWSPLFNSHEKLGLPEYDAPDPEPIPEAAAKMFKFLSADEDDDSDQDVDHKSIWQHLQYFFKFMTTKTWNYDADDVDDSKLYKDDDLEMVDLDD